MPDSTDSSGSPDLVASTGLNDQSSPWNGLLQTALTTGTTLAGDAINSALQLQTPQSVQAGNGSPSNPAPAPAPAAAPAPSASNSNMMLWLLGGLAVVAAYFFFARE